MTEQITLPPPGQAGAVQVEREPASAIAPRPRARSRSSLLANGESMIWLTGGALVLSVLMIVGLLGLVVYFGLSTFWPTPITRLETLDGRVYMGEVTRSDVYEPGPTYMGKIDPAHRTTVRNRLTEQGGATLRRLVRTGNFRLTQQHFRWVDETVVAKETAPEWAVVMERLEWGRFYGFPEAFAFVNYVSQEDGQGNKRTLDDLKADVLDRAEAITRESGREALFMVEAWKDGREQELLVPAGDLDGVSAILGVARVTRGYAAAWAQFREHHAACLERLERRRDLEKYEIGKINHRQEEARLRVKEAELELQDIKRAYGEDSLRYAQAQEALRAAEANYASLSQWAGEEYARIREKINEINRDNGRYRLVMETAGEGAAPPKTALTRLDGVVRAYPANRLGLADKIRVYFSRWWEFLSAEPREANSEGGVFPAIFGTVAMTFIMIIVVVPFGVLAALYLREYAKAGPIVSAVRIAVNNLAGVPSIVFGVFGLGFFCYGVGSFIDGGPQSAWSVSRWTSLLVVWGVSVAAGAALWTAFFEHIESQASWPLRYFRGIFLTVWVGAVLAGAFVLVAQIPFFDGFFRAQLPNPTYGKGGLLWASLTLALLTLPVVIVATEEALSAVPNSMREGSYACGASKWQTIKRIVLPRAMPGIMTGTVLAMARGAGEVAPLMLVGAVKLAPELPVDSMFPFLHPERSFMHLGFHIYDVGFQSQNSEAAKPMVYTTTMLLISLVVLMNVTAIFLRNRLRKRFVVQAF